MAWTHTIRPLRIFRRYGRANTWLIRSTVPQAPSRLVGHLVSSAILLGAAGATSFSKSPVCAEEEDDDDEDDLPLDKNWNRCQQKQTGIGPRVFVWGHRACLPVCEETGDKAPDGDLRVPTEIAWFRRQTEQCGSSWQQLSFGPSFGAARTETGDIFVWGSCSGRDGRGRQYISPRPLLFKDGSEFRFRDVQCSESSVWALTTEGVVIVWELVPSMMTEQAATNSSRGFCCGGKQLNGLSKPVRQMSVGVSHAAFLTQDGEVYCLGKNSCGECGADPAVHGMASAVRKVKFPRHCSPILRVECGKAHTVAVGAEGQCLAWGDDSKIQLGLGDTRSNVGDERPFSGSRGFIAQRETGQAMAQTSALRGGPESSGARAPSTSQKKYGEFDSHYQWRPVSMMSIPLEFERQVHGTPYPPPSDVKCGDDFTLLLVRDSPDWFPPEEESCRMFCCGENGRGQCGRSMQQQQQIFAACKLPRNSMNLGFSCGSAHCLSVLRRVGSKKQELWCWGSNSNGQAGGTNAGVVCPASRLRLPKGTRVEAAWTGFSSSAVICSDLKSTKNV